MSNLQFRRFNFSQNKMEYSRDLGLEIYFQNGCGEQVSDDMQFTGPHDCDGVKIFAGDIISDHNGIGSVEYSEKKAAFKVNYHDGFAKWFIDYNLKGERDSIKVIGNIHQHAHLLEQTK